MCQIPLAQGQTPRKDETTETTQTWKSQESGAGTEGSQREYILLKAVAWQNRQALDWLLAEKGGVCALIGEMGCTFIPNNTAPDGSFTLAMNNLEESGDWERMLYGEIDWSETGEETGM